MPVPTIPTTKEIRDRIINDIESKINQNTPLFAKALNRVLAAAAAGAFTILYKYGQWALKQIFTITQDQDSLLLKGDQYDIPPTDSQASELTAEFTGTAGTIIPAGKEYRGNSNGLKYSVKEALEVEGGGTVEGNVLCLTAGSAGNLVNGSIITILQPIPDLNNQAEITATVIEGEDVEDIEDYRVRIQDRERTPPQGGSLVDYIVWAREVEDITRAFAFGHREVSGITEGYVYVYPLTDNDPGGRIPSGAKLTEVHDYIDDPARAPTQVVEIVVAAMTEKTFNITVTALSPNTAEIRDRFATNVEQYLLDRQPQQFDDEVDPKNVISRSGIESIYIASGAQSVTLTIDMGAGSIESYTLQYNELSILGSITGP